MVPGASKPRLDAAPSAAEIASITDPIERAERISRVAQTFGTLPGALAKLRVEALAEARAAGHAVAALAAWVGLSPGRISQLTGMKTRPDASTSSLAHICAAPGAPPSAPAKTAAGADFHTLAAEATA